MTASFVSNPGRQNRRQKTAQRQPQIKSDELKPSFHTAEAKPQINWVTPFAFSGHLSMQKG